LYSNYLYLINESLGHFEEEFKIYAALYNNETNIFILLNDEQYEYISTNNMLTFNRASGLFEAERRIKYFKRSLEMIK